MIFIGQEVKGAEIEKPKEHWILEGFALFNENSLCWLECRAPAVLPVFEWLINVTFAPFNSVHEFINYDLFVFMRYYYAGDSRAL